MGRIVVVAYRPKSGKSDALKELIGGHLKILAAEKLVTPRKAITMEAHDGTIIEVFEWASAEAIERAHSNPNVLRLWSAFAEVCDYVPIGQVAEASKLFSEFTALEL